MLAVETESPLNVMGTVCRTIVSGTQTAGQLAIVHIETPEPGMGVPEHVHELEDETFHVLSGRVRITLGDQEVVAGPGETVLGRRGERHSWFSLEPLQMIVSATPAGLEEMFVDIDALGATATPAEVIELCKSYAIAFTRR